MIPEILNKYLVESEYNPDLKDIDCMGMYKLKQDLEADRAAFAGAFAEWVHQYYFKLYPSQNWKHITKPDNKQYTTADLLALFTPIYQPKIKRND